MLAAFFTPNDIARLSATMDPARPTGLDYYPLLTAGERFPTNDPNLAPRLTPRPDDDATFLQGMFEAIARIEAEGYALIADHGGPKPTQIFTAGGASENATFSAIRQRYLGVTLSRSTESEASIGAAKLPALAP